MPRHIHIHMTATPARTRDSYSAKAEDSEENDAYIKGYQDAMAGKQPDKEFHPGGSKKPSVTLQYAEGHKRGVDDRKKRGTKDDFSPRINIKGSTFVSTGGLRRDKRDPSKFNAEYEEMDIKGNRTGRKVWIAEGGMILNDEHGIKK